MARPIESSDDLSLADVRQVLATLLAQVGALQEEVAELRLTVAARDAKIAEPEAGWRTTL
jgi:hypothetical protein